jgi:hypothetical protein
MIETPNPITTEPSSGFAEFVLLRVHVERIQMRLALNLLNAAGAALKGGLIEAVLPPVEASS